MTLNFFKQTKQFQILLTIVQKFSTVLWIHFNFILGQRCATPDRQFGICVSIRNCEPLLTLLQTEGLAAGDYLRQSVCIFDDYDPIVCCPEERGREEPVEKENVYGPLYPPYCGFSNISHTKVINGVPAELGTFYSILFSFHSTIEQ